jgi:hypothetical protein
MVSILLSTRSGVGVHPDTVTYVEAAQNLLNGVGLRVLSDDGEFTVLTHFPPLYSIVLALFGLIGWDPLSGARWMNSFLFAANGLITGLLVRRYNQSNLIFFSTLFLFATSVDMLSIHAMTYSEPLFIFLCLMGTSFFLRYLDTQRSKPLVISSGCFALALLSRYAGIFLLMLGALSIWMMDSEQKARKLKDSLIFTAIYSFPIGLWIARNLVVYKHATDRELSFHPLTIGHIKSGLSTVSLWLFPSMIPGPVRVGMTMVVLVGLFLLGVDRRFGHKLEWYADQRR